jgi:hypothetical protein
MATGSGLTRLAQHARAAKLRLDIDRDSGDSETITSAVAMMSSKERGRYV